MKCTTHQCKFYDESMEEHCSHGEPPTCEKRKKIEEWTEQFIRCELKQSLIDCVIALIKSGVVVMNDADKSPWWDESGRGV